MDCVVEEKLFKTLVGFLDENQKRYVDFDGCKGLDNKDEQRLKIYFILFVFIFAFLVAIKEIIKVLGLEGEWIDSLLYWLFLLLPILALINMRYESNLKDKMKEAEIMNTLDFLLSVKNKLSEEDYSQLYKVVEKQDVFETPIVLFMLKCKKKFNELKVKQIDEIKRLEEIKKEETFNKRKIIAKMNVNK